MNIDTGEVFKLNGKSLEEFCAQEGLNPKRMVVLKHGPDGKCLKCGGRGSIRRGVFSNRWKPCPCTYAENQTPQENESAT